jgi:rod shape determining protein RodA
MLDPRLRKRIDWPLLGFVFALAAFGVLIIFSATHGDPTAFYKKQLIWIAIGSVGMTIATVLDYHIYARFSRYLYLLNLALLGFIVKYGHASNGAARWIKFGMFQFQPSEFAKLFIILTLAFFLAKRFDSIRKPQTVLLSFVFVAIPMALIVKQPDLGTGLVVLAIWFGMVYMAGARLLHLAAFVLAGAMLFTAMWFTGKGLNDYQKHRIEVFLNPEADPQKTGYHVTQARIAIGSGGMWGKGLLQSTQVKGGYIPEKQTDFIYTDVGEELGFVGCVVVIVLYGGLLFRGMTIIAASDEDISGKLIATGIVTMFAFHVIENIGMNIGLMPVAGVPLLLISYGGSSMMTTLFCIGLLQSVSIHRHQLMF